MGFMINSQRRESLPPDSGRAGRQSRFPRWRRQLHPWIIHFPITFLLSTTFFSLLYLLTGIKCFQDTAWYCLVGGVIFVPLAIATGFYTEKANFPDPPQNARTERILSLILLAATTAAFIWGLVQPDILDHLQGLNVIYLLLIIFLTPLVTVIGYVGGMITFPLE